MNNRYLQNLSFSFLGKIFLVATFCFSSYQSPLAGNEFIPVSYFITYPYPELLELDKTLTPEEFQKVKKDWSDLQAAFKTYQAVITRAKKEDHLYHTAFEGFERAYNLEVLKDDSKTRDYFKQNPKLNYKNEEYRLTQYFQSAFKPTDDLILLYVWFSKSRNKTEDLSELKESFISSGLVEDLLPDNNEKLTDEVAINIYHEFLKRSHNKRYPNNKCPKHNHPEYIIKYFKMKSESDALFYVCEPYVRYKTPKYLYEAKEVFNKEFSYHFRHNEQAKHAKNKSFKKFDKKTLKKMATESYQPLK